MFTPSTDWRERAQFGIGIACAIGGAAAWTYSSKALGGVGLGSVLPWNPTASAILLPISIPLLIGGVGLSTYYFAMRKTWRASNRIESAIYELEALVGPKNELGDSLAPGSGTSLDPAPGKTPRIKFGASALAFAVAEAIILLAMYIGLVREYTSNLNMQNWVRANFSLGVYVLSYNAVLGLAGILGVVLFQLVPRKIRSGKASSQS